MKVKLIEAHGDPLNRVHHRCKTHLYICKDICGICWCQVALFNHAVVVQPAVHTCN